MSRVVHMRIPDNILIACYDVLSDVGRINTDGMPVSTVVVRALTAMVKGLRNQEMIDTYDDPHKLMTKLHHYLGTEASLPDESKMFLDFTEDDDERKSGADVIRNFVDEAVAMMSEGGIKSEFEHQEVSADTNQPSSQVDFDTVARTPYEDLRYKAPKDRLIQAAAEDQALQLCLEVVYHTMPIEYWGSDMAERSIRTIMQDAEQYVIMQGEDDGTTED